MGETSHLMTSSTLEKIRFFSINCEHAEDSFEASNRNISKVRRKIRNKIEETNTQVKLIELNRTAHMQF